MNPSSGSHLRSPNTNNHERSNPLMEFSISKREGEGGCHKEKIGRINFLGLIPRHLFITS